MARRAGMALGDLTARRTQMRARFAAVLAGIAMLCGFCAAVLVALAAGAGPAVSDPVLGVHGFVTDPAFNGINGCTVTATHGEQSFTGQTQFGFGSDGYYAIDIPSASVDWTVTVTVTDCNGFVVPQNPFGQPNPLPVTNFYDTDFHMAAGGNLAGSVASSVGATPLGGCTVTATPASGPALTATTDSSGRYAFVAIAVGAYSVSVTSCANYVVPQASVPSSVTVAQYVTATANVAMRRLGQVTGAVASQQGVSVSGCVVSATPTGGGTVVTGTVSGGSYTVANVVPGVYNVALTACAGYTVPSPFGSNPVTVPDGGSAGAGSATANLAPSVIVGTVGGTVSTATGASPLSGCAVSVVPVSSGSAPATATTDGAGAYTVGNLLPGGYTVTVTSCPNYVVPQASGSSPVTVAGGATATANVAMRRFGQVTGVVASSQGVPVDGCVVSVTPVGGGTAVTATVAAGSYTVNVAPGLFVVSLTTCAGYSVPQFSPSNPVTVLDGGTSTSSVTADLAPSLIVGSISGTVTSAVGATPLSGCVLTIAPVSTGSPATVAATNAQGVYSVANLVPAAYAVSVTTCANYAVPQVAASSPVTVVGVVTATANVALGRLGQVAGTVATQQGVSVNGCVVSATPTGGGTAVTGTVTAGSYVISGLAPGQYDIALTTCSGYSVPQAAGANPVTLPDGGSAAPAVVTADLAPSVIVGAISGRLTNSSAGAPVAGCTVSAVPVAGGGAVTAVSDGGGAYVIDDLLPGTYSVQVTACAFYLVPQSSAANPATVTANAVTPNVDVVVVPNVVPTVFRTGTWFGSGVPSVVFGQAGDIPVASFWTSSGLTTRAVWRPSNGRWYIQGANPDGIRFGNPATDVAVPADFDGDGVSEIAVFRVTTGRWYTQANPAGFAFGQRGDIPVPGDWGSGRAEAAVYRPSNGTWYSQSNPVGVRFGSPGDVPQAGPWGGGRRFVPAVFRRSTGVWYLASNPVAVRFGLANDRPVANFWGGSAFTVAVFRPSTGTWFWPANPSGTRFGNPADADVPNAYGPPVVGCGAVVGRGVRVC